MQRYSRDRKVEIGSFARLCVRSEKMKLFFELHAGFQISNKLMVVKLFFEMDCKFFIK